MQMSPDALIYRPDAVIYSPGPCVFPSVRVRELGKKQIRVEAVHTNSLANLRRKKIVYQFT